MLKLKIVADCGNAPRKHFLKDFNIAFAEANTSFITDNIRDDIRWHIIGDKHIQGKQEFIQALEQMANGQVTELSILNIITHGKEAAVNGTLTMADGKKYAFCDVYEFGSTKGNVIKLMTSYVI